MIKSAHFVSFTRLMLMTMALLLAACASTAPVEEPAPEPETEIEPWDGDGMLIPLDGSSMEAWDRSLARVKAHTTPEQYRAVEGAIKYLLLYDLESYGDKNKLIQRLDGMTGMDLVGKVKWWQPDKERQERQNKLKEKEATETITS